MTILDYIIFALYMAAIIGVGVYFYLKNVDEEDYFVGGRSLTAGHVGLSIAATDVGGGFSIGLGGLGYAIGLTGSWLLFTGLVGAWLSAVFIIPRIKRVDAKHGMMTYPDFLRFRYDDKVATVAAIISTLGYLGFTSGQVLAGAKLMAGSVIETAPFGMDIMTFSVLIIGFVIVVYTVLGGLKAVIYTDTVQWIILIVGLVAFAIPFGLADVGWWSGLKEALPASHFSFTNVDLPTFVNWMVTVIPIWAVAMTLYQRMYASRSEAQARKAWFIAGVFEYPAMAFTGVFLGMMARILVPGVEAELGVPILLKIVLPAGITGLVIASYFSAIMSTADSCIIASSGNFVGDIIQRSRFRVKTHKAVVLLSQGSTFLIGVTAILIATTFATVLDAILHAYSFLVAGLFIPTLGAYFWKGATSKGAFWGMVTGGGLTLVLLVGRWELPWGLDPSFWGILVSGTVFYLTSVLTREPGAVPQSARELAGEVEVGREKPRRPTRKAE